MAKDCAVFISSTSEDLKEYRLAAEEAVKRVGLRPVMMEYFAASGGPPLHECLRKVESCQVVVALVAERYGWVPPDQQPAGECRSITWLECAHGDVLGKDLLVFFPEPGYSWPVEKTEAFRLTDAFNKQTFTSDLPIEIARNQKKLKEFRAWLNERTRATFTTPDDLKVKVIQALHEWLTKHEEFRQTPSQGDPQLYLEDLREQCGWIDIRGLQVGSGKANRFPIEELYIPLATAEAMERKAVPIEESLRYHRLVVIGDAGAGKTTFLRHVARRLAGDYLAGADRAPLPIFVRVTELLDCIRRLKSTVTHGAESPRWLPELLGQRADELNLKLPGSYFRERLEGGNCAVLLDGLDEAANGAEREAVVRLLGEATRAYRQCRFVVTTRPLTYTGRSELAGFTTVQIEPLEDEAIALFLDRWCAALFPGNPGAARQHLKGLTEALWSMPDIRRMAHNPVMLTALAVVHWNERRLPEQRADLYESIVNWLVRSREMRAGRVPAERCSTLLQQLALAMQNDVEGRQVHVEKWWAADALGARFEGPTEGERRAKALAFVEQEEVDSGLIVSRGAKVRFGHLTFQEFLAARAAAGMGDADLWKLLLDSGAIYKPEWREMVFILAGILHRQGATKVDLLVSATLNHLGLSAPLAEKAKYAAVLGGMVNDLRSVGYQPSDRRYGELMDAVLAIFDKEKAYGIDFKVRLEAAEALGQAGDPRLRQSNWVRIEEGAFRMGEPPGREVTVATFEIGKYPVTVEEYRRFVEDGGYQEGRWWSAGGFGTYEKPGYWNAQTEHPNRALMGVSWFEAAAYAAWAGVRLPREAEWEFAARGREAREYPWGKDDPDATRANYGATRLRQVTPVGLYPAGATPDGVQDLAGNVWEWVDERWDEIKGWRVIRGGSWVDVEAGLRAALRYSYEPEVSYDYIGFRLARDVLP